MSFGSQPAPLNAGEVSQQQQQYNQNAATAQQKTNMIGKETPFGSLSYIPDPNSPGGYRAVTTMGAPQSALYGAAGNLANSAANFYSGMPNIDPSSLTNKMMGWGQQYMQPIFDQQQSNLDSKLRNQGIAPGSAAWDNAQNLQSRNVNNAYQNLFLNAEPQAFQQAMQEYQLPMQTLGGLFGLSNPTAQNAVQTPTAQIQPANYSGNAYNSWNQANQNYQNNMAGWGMAANIGGKLLGSFAGGF